MKIKIQSDKIFELYEPYLWVSVLAITLLVIGFSSIILSFFIPHEIWIPAGLFIILFGTVFLIVKGTNTITFDKSTDKISLVRKTIFGSHSESYKISEVTSIMFRFVTKPTFRKAVNSNGRATSPIFLTLVLSDNSYVHIGDTIWSNPSALLQPAGKSSWRPRIGQHLANFLGVPYNEQTTSRSDYFEHTKLE